MTNKEKIDEIREKYNLQITAFEEYDENGECIGYFDLSDLTESIEEKFDEKGNIIYKKDYHGYEYWYTYDEKGNNIYNKYSQGDFEVWMEYDENGRMIYYKDSSGYEEWYTYDENGKITIERNRM